MSDRVSSFGHNIVSHVANILLCPIVSLSLDQDVIINMSRGKISRFPFSLGMITRATDDMPDIDDTV